MSPTIFRAGGFRFYFFSREEAGCTCTFRVPAGEAKFWLEPKIELAQNYGLTSRQVNIVLRLIGEHCHHLRSAGSHQND
jgi:Domain of unknown function (DUF4160)